jgi:hypothetical protein
MEMNGELHASVTLLSRKQFPVPIVYKAGWDLEPVWKLWRRRAIVSCFCLNSKRDSSVVQWTVRAPKADEVI